MKFIFCLSVLAGMYPWLSTLSYKARVNIGWSEAEAGCVEGAKEESRKTVRSIIRGLPSQTPKALGTGWAPVLSYGVGYGVHLPQRMLNSECSTLVIPKCGLHHTVGKPSVVTRTEYSFWHLICTLFQKLRDSECREWRTWEQKIKC